MATVDAGTAQQTRACKFGTDTAVVSGESWPVGGDLIVSADGIPLSSVDQLSDLIREKAGPVHFLEVYRGRKKLTLEVKLGRQPSSPG